MMRVSKTFSFFRPSFRLALASPLVILLSLACANPEPADEVEIAGSPTSCTGCRIELGAPLELRADQPGESVIVLSPAAVTTDGLGRYWVAELHQAARVYDTNGKFLKTLGKKGGPANDIESPFAFLPLPGDSMLVFDYTHGLRGFVVDSQFHTVRTVVVPGNTPLMPASAEGWPARVLLTGPLLRDSSEGEVLHTISAENPEATVIKSFGAEKVPKELGNTMAFYRRVTSAKDGGYWAADILRYRISHFSKDGTLLGTIERAPDWFPTPSADNIGMPDVAPPPRMLGVWTAPDGLLWVFGRVASKNWKSAWPQMLPGTKEVSVAAVHFEKLYSTVIEVLDPLTRNVVTTAKLDDYLTDVLPDGNVAVFAKDSAGTAHLTIRRLSLMK